MVAGMSAANLQGVLAATVDVDVWISLPARQYMRVINLCRKLNASPQSPGFRGGSSAAGVRGPPVSREQNQVECASPTARRGRGFR